MLNESSHDLLKKFKSTLHMTSKNSADHTYLCNLNLQVVNFDNFKNKYLKTYCNAVQGVRSADALYLGDDNLDVLIEFKDEKREGEGLTKNSEVIDQVLFLKAYGSVILISHATNATPSEISENIVFYLVYSKEKNQMIALNDHFVRKSGKIPEAHFGLKHLKGFLFKDVRTFDSDYFNFIFNKGFDCIGDLL